MGFFLKNGCTPYENRHSIIAGVSIGFHAFAGLQWVSGKLRAQIIQIEGFRYQDFAGPPKIMYNHGFSTAVSAMGPLLYLFWRLR